MSTSPFDEINHFLIDECEKLDSGDYEGWLDLFAADGLYWVPLAPGQESPESDHSLFCENVLLLTMRVERMRHPSAHGMAGQLRTNRLIGNVQILESTANSARASARFVLVELENQRERLFTGKLTYDLVRVGSQWRIQRKRVDLLNCDAPLASIQILF